MFHVKHPYVSQGDLPIGVHIGSARIVPLIGACWWGVKGAV